MTVEPPWHRQGQGAQIMEGGGGGGPLSNVNYEK